MIRNKRIAIFLFLLLALAAVRAGSASAEAVCFDCHKRSAFVQKVVHQPVAKGQCTTCHNPHVARHEGLLQSDMTDLCFSCHRDEEKSFFKGVVHQPVLRGNCTACHEPHSSGVEGLMKGRLSDSCFECHKNLQKKYKFNHKPYVSGECSACHRPHQADNYQLLKTSAEKLCRSCHSDGVIAGAHKNYPVKINGCLTCHNPHGSNNKSIMRDVKHAPFVDDCGKCHKGGDQKVTKDTCLNCHSEIMDQLLRSHNHLTDSSGNSCINCHSPHAGDTKQLLNNSQPIVCRKCHEDTYKRHEKNLFIHEATARDCDKCHDLHGSNQVALLKGDGNKVCLVCHETQGQFSHPVGAGIKDPRNRQMTTCVSCHNPHGTDFKGQLVLSGQEDLCLQCHHL